jgi:hypothetical protein
MSYNVAISKPPIPEDDAEAWKVVYQRIDRLHAEEAEPAPVFVELHDRLTERYPCICDLLDDEVDDGVWSDGPLINNFGAECAVIGMVYDAAAEVLPFVVAESNRRGLVVFDWASERISRPPVERAA